MRERVGIVVCALIVVFGYPAPAGAAVPGTDVGDSVDDVTDSTTEVVDDAVGTVTDTVEDTAGAATDTVEDTAGGATEAVEDTAGAATDTVEDTAGGATEAVEDAAGAATEAVEDAAGAATEAVEDTAGGATEAVEDTAGGATEAVEDTAGGATEAVEDAAGAATDTVEDTAGGATEAVEDAAGGATEDEAPDTTTARTSSGESLLLQPDGRGSFMELDGSLGFAALTATEPSPRSLGVSTAGPGQARAESGETLVATVRVGEDEPFVATVGFETAADAITVRLERTGGSPLDDVDGRGDATREFHGYVLMSGHDVFLADVQVIVRDDGLVLLVDPAGGAIASVTEVLAGVVERLSRTGLALVPLGALAVGLIAAGGVAVRSSRKRRWAGAVTSARP